MYEVEIPKIKTGYQKWSGSTSKYTPIIIDGIGTTLENYVLEQMSKTGEQRDFEQRKERAELKKKEIKKSRFFGTATVLGIIGAVQTALFFVNNEARTPIRIYAEIAIFSAISLFLAIRHQWKADDIK